MSVFWVLAGLAGLAVLVAVVLTVSELLLHSAGPGDVYPP